MVRLVQTCRRTGRRNTSSRSLSEALRWRPGLVEAIRTMVRSQSRPERNSNDIQSIDLAPLSLRKPMARRSHRHKIIELSRARPIRVTLV